MAPARAYPESTLREEPITLLFCPIDDALPHAQPKRAKVRYPQAALGFQNSRPRTLTSSEVSRHILPDRPADALRLALELVTGTARTREIPGTDGVCYARAMDTKVARTPWKEGASV